MVRALLGASSNDQRAINEVARSVIPDATDEEIQAAMDEHLEMAREERESATIH
jgi:hypothetical protein